MMAISLISLFAFGKKEVGNFCNEADNPFKNFVDKRNFKLDSIFKVVDGWNQSYQIRKSAYDSLKMAYGNYQKRVNDWVDNQVLLLDEIDTEKLKKKELNAKLNTYFTDFPKKLNELRREDSLGFLAFNGLFLEMNEGSKVVVTIGVAVTFVWVTFVQPIVIPWLQKKMKDFLENSDFGGKSKFTEVFNQQKKCIKENMLIPLRLPHWDSKVKPFTFGPEERNSEKIDLSVIAKKKSNVGTNTGTIGGTEPIRSPIKPQPKLRNIQETRFASNETRYSDKNESIISYRINDQILELHSLNENPNSLNIMAIEEKAGLNQIDSLFIDGLISLPVSSSDDSPSTFYWHSQRDKSSQNRIWLSSKNGQLSMNGTTMNDNRFNGSIKKYNIRSSGDFMNNFHRISIVIKPFGNSTISRVYLDGRFAFELPQPMQAGNEAGIMLPPGNVNNKILLKSLKLQAWAKNPVTDKSKNEQQKMESGTGVIGAYEDSREIDGVPSELEDLTKAFKYDAQEGGKADGPCLRVLCIGVNKYFRGNAIKGDDYKIKDLKFSVKDARAMAAFFKKMRAKNFDLILLEDFRATKQAILSQLDSLINRSGPQDQLYVYFSGHGTAEALVPSDFNPQDYRTAVTYQELVDIMNKKKLLAKTLLLDCCHSGSIKTGLQGAKGAGDGEEESKSLDKFDALRQQFSGLSQTNKNANYSSFVSAVCSSSAEQLSYEYGANMQHGKFTFWLLNGALSGDADNNGDGLISYDECVNFLRARVNDDRQSIKCFMNRQGRALPVLPVLND
jgi:hypothetical protein